MLPPFRRQGSAVVLLVALLWPCAVPAEAGQKAKWWRSELYQRELGLTSDQVSQIERIFQDSWPSLQGSKEELDRLEKELSQAIAEGTAEESRVVRLIDRVETSRSALGRTRSLMLFRIHRLLTPVQRTRLKTLHEEQHRAHKDSGQSSR